MHFFKDSYDYRQIQAEKQSRPRKGPESPTGRGGGAAAPDFGLNLRLYWSNPAILQTGIARGSTAGLALRDSFLVWARARHSTNSGGG
jgi:hypothetical protein